MSETKFIAYVIGAVSQGRREEWPDPPAASDGSPAWRVTNEWVGCFIAAFPSEAAREFLCGTFGTGEAFRTADDVSEYFDCEASNAMEEWRAYRELCLAAGFDPGEGHVMLVTGWM